MFLQRFPLQFQYLFSLQKLFHIVVIRNDLTTVDVKILYYLSQPHDKCTKKDMAGVLGISGRQLSGSIQRLLNKDLISEKEKQRDRAIRGIKDKQQENGKNENVKEYVVAQEAENILSEIEFVLCDLGQIQYEGFSQEEIELYEKLDEMRRKNIKKTLII